MNGPLPMDAELLMAYLDNELGPAERALAERLLAESAEARRLLAEWQGFHADLAALPVTPAPASLVDRVLSEIQALPLHSSPSEHPPSEGPGDLPSDATSDDHQVIPLGSLPLTTEPVFTRGWFGLSYRAWQTSIGLATAAAVAAVIVAPYWFESSPLTSMPVAQFTSPSAADLEREKELLQRAEEEEAALGDHSFKERATFSSTTQTGVTTHTGAAAPQLADQVVEPKGLPSEVQLQGGAAGAAAPFAPASRSDDGDDRPSMELKRFDGDDGASLPQKKATASESGAKGDARQSDPVPVRPAPESETVRRSGPTAPRTAAKAPGTATPAMAPSAPLADEDARKREPAAGRERDANSNRDANGNKVERPAGAAMPAPALESAPPSQAAQDEKAKAAAANAKPEAAAARAPADAEDKARQARKLADGESKGGAGGGVGGGGGVGTSTPAMATPAAKATPEDGQKPQAAKTIESDRAKVPETRDAKPESPGNRGKSGLPGEKQFKAVAPAPGAVPKAEGGPAEFAAPASPAAPVAAAAPSEAAIEPKAEPRAFGGGTLRMQAGVEEDAAADQAWRDEPVLIVQFDLSVAAIQSGVLDEFLSQHAVDWDAATGEVSQLAMLDERTAVDRLAANQPTDLEPQSTPVGPAGLAGTATRPNALVEGSSGDGTTTRFKREHEERGLQKADSQWEAIAIDGDAAGIADLVAQLQAQSQVFGEVEVAVARLETLETAAESPATCGDSKDAQRKAGEVRRGAPLQYGQRGLRGVQRDEKPGEGAKTAGAGKGQGQGGPTPAGDDVDRGERPSTEPQAGFAKPAAPPAPAAVVRQEQQQLGEDESKADDSSIPTRARRMTLSDGVRKQVEELTKTLPQPGYRTEKTPAPASKQGGNASLATGDASVTTDDPRPKESGEAAPALGSALVEVAPPTAADAKGLPAVTTRGARRMLIVVRVLPVIAAPASGATVAPKAADAPRPSDKSQPADAPAPAVDPQPAAQPKAAEAK